MNPLFMEYRKYGAELLGTFALTLAVSLSIVGKLPLPTAVIAALTLGIYVYIVGGISGAHLNPAVTIGLFSVRRIDTPSAVKYIAAQILGALLASLIVQMFYGHGPSLIVQDTVLVAVGEILGAFFLVMGVSAVVENKVPVGAAGVVIGGSLLLGILVASTVSNGVLNPAVALGIRSVSLFYILAPIVGGILGAQTYALLLGK